MLRYTAEMVTENIAEVKRRMELAAGQAGRDLAGVRLVAVTKQATIEQVREAVEAGISDIGENRVKEALLKKAELDSHIVTWHMIGHLQTNKVKEALKVFSLIHSVDSIKLAETIDKEAGKIGKVQDVLVEVNVSGEGSKFGIKPAVLGNFLEETGRLKNIRVLGLMTMAPFADDAEDARPDFKKLKELAVRYNLKELSMGMTQDFEVAVEEGATIVRIGMAIFERGQVSRDLSPPKGAK